MFLKSLYRRDKEGCSGSWDNQLGGVGTTSPAAIGESTLPVPPRRSALSLNSASLNHRLA